MAGGWQRACGWRGGEERASRGGESAGVRGVPGEAVWVGEER